VGLDAGAGREWLLYWTARDRPVPRSRVPVLAGWADLDQREADAGITARHPILIDPQYRIDPVLARFLAASRFTWLAEGTREAYAKDYRLFFSFLWQRGKYWHEADPDDLLDWESWRRRSQPGRRIGGSKWQRELAALRLLYEWAEKKGRIGRSPVLVHAVRLRDGGTVMAADQAPRDVRCSDVKWVTPRTYRLWRDIGLRGYTAGGLPEAGWRGRNDGRNCAFADLLFESVVEGLLVSGNVQGLMVLSCARCLRPFESPFDLSVQELFAPGARPEDDEYPVEEGAVDLEPMIRDSVVLAMPFSPLCTPGCLGLCARCGGDRNTGECTCPPGEPGPA